MRKGDIMIQPKLAYVSKYISSLQTEYYQAFHFNENYDVLCSRLQLVASISQIKIQFCLYHDYVLLQETNKNYQAENYLAEIASYIKYYEYHLNTKWDRIELFYSACPACVEIGVYEWKSRIVCPECFTKNFCRDLQEKLRENNSIDYSLDRNIKEILQKERQRIIARGHQFGLFSLWRILPDVRNKKPPVGSMIPYASCV